MRTIADLMPEIEQAVADSLDGGPCLETAIARMVLGRDPQPEDPQWTPEQRAVFLVAVDLWRPRFHARKKARPAEPPKPDDVVRYCAACDKPLTRNTGESTRFFRKRQSCDRVCAGAARRKAS